MKIRKYLIIIMAGLFLALPVKAADLVKGLEAYERGDYQAARAEIVPLAEAGDAEAQFYLGFMYAYGDGVLQDYAEALKWYRLSAEQGDAQAQYNLGVMYDDGLGVPQDYAEAAKWYRLASEQGYTSAQVHLGLMYYGGLGVPQDFSTAHVWLNIATANGNTLSAEWRDNAAEQMTSANVSTAQALARKCLATNYADCP